MSFKTLRNCWHNLSSTLGDDAAHDVDIRVSWGVWQHLSE